MNLKIAGALGVAIGALLVGSTAQAATITWANWTSNTTGTDGAVGLTYAGELAGYSLTPSYTPVTSFQGNGVDNAPAATDDSILLTGGSDQIDTVTFASPVTNPVFAIWSLGQNNDPTSFHFLNSPTFSIAAGGPTAQYGGLSITQSGDDVTGVEGNGLLQFVGTYSSISWQNPSHEYYYAFTVGTPGVPEPASWALMIGGFGAAGVAMRRRRAAVAA